MEIVLRHRGRDITAEEVALIRDFVACHPTLSRWALSRELCRVRHWRQENGALKDMVCRELMLALHRAGAIELPPQRRTPRNPLADRRPPAPVLVDRAPLCVPLADLGRVELCAVRGTAEEAIVDALLEEHHYLGYTHPVGEQLKYLVLARARPVACFAWSSAPRHLGPRDRFIGWSREARRRNIRFLAYNARFLVLPWVRVPHLASHLLGRVARQIAGDWEAAYGHPVHYLESFVDPGRFAGTCYRAANWRFLGLTTGRGKDDHTNRPNRPPKEVLGLALTKRFRELLGALR